jgi:hypothetical protein
MLLHFGLSIENYGWLQVGMPIKFSFWKLERKFRQAIMTLVVSGDDD